RGAAGLGSWGKFQDRHIVVPRYPGRQYFLTGIWDEVLIKIRRKKWFVLTREKQTFLFETTGFVLASYVEKKKKEVHGRMGFGFMYENSKYFRAIELECVDWNLQIYGVRFCQDFWVDVTGGYTGPYGDINWYPSHLEFGFCEKDKWRKLDQLKYSDLL
ncbi:unnamed protein product, partial [Allacma fusca]